MSTNLDLAGWGEGPATPAEEALGTLLDKVLTKIERGQAVKPEALRGDRPELVERGQGLMRTLNLLYECADSVWENSRLEPGDDVRGPSGNSTPSPPSIALLRPGKPEGKIEGPQVGMAVGLPDPFPGRFRILQVLGEGAFGKVLLAEDLDLGRRVALKTLRSPAISAGGPRVLDALRKEAQYLAKLDHPNIVRVHAWLESEGEYYLVLQFVDGGSLADRVKTNRVLAWQDAARYIADVGEALVAAHKHGVVHRDIKPDNILWDATRDEAILTDFGVSARLAEPGTVAGTPIYMAAEAFEGQVSPALDVYSLAATLYRLVTGELPFANAPVPNLVYQKLQGLPDPDPRCRAIPETLERVIRAGLEGKPRDRPSMHDFVTTLRGSLNRLLADVLVKPRVDARSKAPMKLRLLVSRHIEADIYEPVATTKPASRGASRDMKMVPRVPEQCSVRTGERVRIEVIADKVGYVTVFNIGPTGNLNLLYPDDPTVAPTPIQENRPLHVVDVEMMPPVGRERVFAVWSKEPLPLRLERLLSITERSGGATRPYQSTRDMKRVQDSMRLLPQEVWHTEVLEINHVAGQEEG